MNSSWATMSYSSSHDQSILLTSQHHRLTSFGSMLPVLMVEAITSDDMPVRSLTININTNGWSWLVCGQSLFVWKFKDANYSKNSASTCYELELPPSDLAFKADLVSLFVDEPTPGTSLSQTTPSRTSLIAISPEGSVRYWSNIAYESSFTESYVHDLQGQECSVLCQLSQNECLLATTTNTLVMITIQHGGSEITYRTLRQPVGVLFGLSRRLTSFFSGGMTVAPATHMDMTGKSFVALFKEVSSSAELSNYSIYAMSGSTIQKWALDGVKEGESLLHEQDIEGVLKHSFIPLLPPSTDPSSTKVVVIDCGLIRTRTLEVFSALVSDSNGFIFLSLSTFVYRGDSQGFSLESFHLVVDPSSLVPRNKNPSDLRLLLCPDRTTIYIYDETKLYFVRGQTIVDSIDFESRDDGILGAGVCDRTPLLFTIKDGLVAISATVIDLPDASNRSLTTQNDSVDSSHLGVFKKSFYLFSRNEKKESESILSSHFDLSQNLGLQQLASVILDFAVNVVDGDMNEEIKLDMSGRTTSTTKSCVRSLNMTSHDLMVTQCLEDKVTTLSVLLDMLDQLPVLISMVTVKSTPIALSVQDLMERVMICLSVKTSFSHFSHFLEPILNMVLAARKIPSRTGSHIFQSQDDFYQEPSRVEDIFPAILKFQEENIASPILDEDEVLQLILCTSDLLVTILNDISMRRTRPVEVIKRFVGQVDKFSPWDSNPGEHGLRRCLSRQLHLLKEKGSRLVSTSDVSRANNRDVLLDKYFLLTNIILSSHWSHLKMLKKGLQPYVLQQKWFEEDRKTFLRDLINFGLLDKALHLAEKYQDFDTIIEVCELTGSEEKLERYRSIFASQDFSGHLTNFYLQHQKPGKVLKMHPSMTSTSNPLLQHRSELLWIQQIQLGDFSAAGQTLKGLGIRESKDMARRKTILSLAKLSSIAGGETPAEVDNLLYDIHVKEMEAISGRQS